MIDKECKCAECRSGVQFFMDLLGAMANAEIGSSTGKGEQRLPEPLLSMVSEIPWTAGVDGLLTWIHPAAKNLYGLTADELIGNPSLRLEAIHPDDRVRVLEHLQDLPTQRTTQYECRFVDVDQHVHRVHESVHYLLSEG